MQKVDALQVFIKTAALSGIAFFWVNFTVESFKMAWRIISSSPEDAAVFNSVCVNCQEHYDDDERHLLYKVVCEKCQELYDDDEYHLIHGAHLCEACR